jgi:hypothetical protein
VGLLGTHPGVLAAAARLSGLRVETVDSGGPGRLVDRALMERWPLVHAGAGDLDGLSGARWQALSTFVQVGGTLYVDGLGPDARLARLGEQLGLPAPEVRPATGARSVRFMDDLPGLTRELTGARLRAASHWPALAPGGGWDVVARAETGSGDLPLVLRHGLGRGAVVLSSGPADVPGRLSDALVAGSATAAAAAVPLMLLRSLYGTAAWHPPAVLANFSVDDPALRRGSLGLRWDLALGQARDHGFHVTIATVPRELALADPAVVALLRRHPSSVSVCYHGCDHDGYEFYATDAARTRHAPRPLAAQRGALRRALEHGGRFTAALGCELDRVMVFPYGAGPAEILPDLHRLGFVGSANFGDKYPPGSAPPDDADLGLRPADVAWSGFPLLWRRGLDDEGLLVDLLLGRPALVFAHPWALGEDLQPFVERAATINRVTAGGARWCGLDEVSRHAYLQRRLPDGGWQVLMTANEACLHNPGPEPRIYAVRRPHRPPDSAFEVDGVISVAEPVVTVPPMGVAVVRLVAGGEPPVLPGRRGCSIFPVAS